METSPFLTLPNETLFHIARFLSVADLNRLVQTCRFFSALLDPYLYDQAAGYFCRNHQELTLLCAARTGQVTTITKLGVRDRSRYISTRRKNKALLLAAEYGQTAVIPLLVNMGADPASNTISIGDEEEDWHDEAPQCSALHWAARHGHQNTIDLLVDLGADLDALDSYGVSVLQYAVRGQNESAVTFLIRKGAQPSVAGIYLDIIQSGNLDLLQLFLDSRVKDIPPLLGDGLTALHYAVIFDDIPAMKLLLGHGVDVNATEEHGSTPLHVGTQTGNIEAVRLLLDHGADFRFPDHLGHCPLHFAVDSRDDNVDMLQHRLGIVQLLLERGADPFALTNQGETALDFVIDYKASRIINLLRNAMERNRNNKEGSIAGDTITQKP
ncbi:ankyrin repeat-containing domain protein [Aspergillus lucknowensis]|uniref:Ankyrin repeat-containing domain protein n=1 Tax=Aspergillus lucknowensis TaxID=176173 RepID=A0ABR4LNJ8_9EURO